MMKFVSRTLLPALAAIMLWPAIFFSHPKPVLAQNESVQVVEVTAKKYEYSPAPIHVKSGAKVQLKITAADHDHGFSILTVPDGSASWVPAIAAATLFASPPRPGTCPPPRCELNLEPHEARYDQQIQPRAMSKRKNHEGDQTDDREKLRHDGPVLQAKLSILMIA